MEGLTDPIMRDVLTHVGSFDWCVTEFIRVTNSVLPDHVYHTYCPELLTEGKTAQIIWIMFTVRERKSPD